MTTFEKKVEIPENHRLLLELTLPADIPPGAAEVTVTIVSTAAKNVKRQHYAGLAGSLADTGDFAGDAMDIQREMRNEW